MGVDSARYLGAKSWMSASKGIVEPQDALHVRKSQENPELF
jgi:hypothetical protein